MTPAGTGGVGGSSLTPAMTLAVAAAALAAGLAAIAPESLWIDEFASLVVADHRTFGRFLEALIGSSQSDGQMPIYMVWLWAWIGLFGTSEWTLRAANLPWFVVGTIGLVRWSRTGRISSARMVTLLVCLSPFLWFYLNEARPYIMQFAGASLFLGGVIAATAQGARGTRARFDSADCWTLAVGAVLLCGSSLLGVPWLLAGLLVLAVSWRAGGLAADRRCLPSALFASILLSILAVYYVGTLLRGAAPFAKDTNFFLTLGASFYELLGFLGLGPSRLDLRLVGLSALRGFVPLLLTAGAIWAAAIAIGGSLLRQRRGSTGRLVLSTMVLVALPVVFLGALSEWRSFRVLGRHMMPLLPVLLLVLAAVLSSLRASSRRWHSSLAVAALLVWGASAASWRLSERHRKDDYRLAAKVAAEALSRGKTVWWAANFRGANYYGVPLEPANRVAAGVVRSRIAPGLLGLSNPRLEELEGLSSPDFLILSKPDLFDAHGVLAAVATNSGYSDSLVAAAFTVYSREPAD